MRFSRISMSLITVGFYVLLRIAVPHVDVGGLDKRLVLLLALLAIPIFMLAQVAVIPGIVRLQPRLRTAIVVLVIGLACIVVVGLAAKAKLPVSPSVLGIGADFALLTSAISLGYVVSFIFREPNILLPVGIVAGLVDLWNVTVGPLGRIVEKRPDIVEKVSVHLPSPAPHLIPMATIGMGDVVFLAMFFAVLYRFSMNVKGAFWLGYVLLTLSVFLAFKVSIPALVPMGIAILVTNIRCFKLSREELFATIYVSLFVAALLGTHAVYTLTRHIR